MLHKRASLSLRSPWADSLDYNWKELRFAQLFFLAFFFSFNYLCGRDVMFYQKLRNLCQANGCFSRDGSSYYNEMVWKERACQSSDTRWKPEEPVFWYFSWLGPLKAPSGDFYSDIWKPYYSTCLLWAHLPSKQCFLSVSLQINTEELFWLSSDQYGMPFKAHFPE